jgi:hypothetical protein
MFAIVFSNITGRSTVHAIECPRAQSRSGYTVSDIEASSPTVAARLWDREQADLGRPKATICRCARYGVGA